MSGEEAEGFLSRWSRRKREAAVEPEPPASADASATTPAVLPEALPAVATPSGEGGAPEPAAEAARPACPIPNLPEVDLASLPRIEDLTAESDFSAFLRPGVPQMLRNAALRRMWSLDPAIRDYIGPVDYQWDFNTPGGLPFGFSNELTGDIGKLLAQAIGQIEKLADEPESPTDSPEPEAPVPSAPDAHPDPPVLVAEQAPDPLPEAPAVAPRAAEEALPVRRRHGGALPG